MNIKLKTRTLAITILVIVMSLGNMMYIYANDMEILSKSAVLIDADKGTIIYQKDPYTQRQIASVSKVMTGLLVIEEGYLDQKVYITKDSANIGGTSFKIDEGMLLSKRDLLNGLLYISGNDAGDALARTSNSGYEGFIGKMNAKAAHLGMVGTRFYDPHGLGSYWQKGAGNNYSTAYDLAILMKAAMSNKEFMAIQKGSVAYTQNPNYPILENANAFMKEYPWAIGAKTGYTGSAGNCEVAMASKDGKSLIAVVLDAPKGTRDKEICKLMDYGFNHYGNYTYEALMLSTKTEQIAMPVSVETPVVSTNVDDVIVDLFG